MPLSRRDALLGLGPLGSVLVSGCNGVRSAGTRTPTDRDDGSSGGGSESGDGDRSDQDGSEDEPVESCPDEPIPDGDVAVGYRQVDGETVADVEITALERASLVHYSHADAEDLLVEDGTVGRTVGATATIRGVESGHEIVFTVIVDPEYEKPGHYPDNEFPESGQTVKMPDCHKRSFTVSPP